ncbi:MAG: hypothetical protein HKO53_02545 [Gemmatimonadetes bacterium]|nr:hypothetical protein [Gemmatimonadota bacterium]
MLTLSGSCGPADRDPHSAPRADTLGLLVYNIHHGEGMDDVVDLRRVADFIQALDPDLVALQEVDSVAQRTGRVDQTAELARMTGLHGHFGRFMSYQGGAYGMAVLSRWPVTDVTNWRLTDGEEPRTALGVRVRLPASGEELLIVGIHFYRTEAERLAQASDLEAVLAEEPGPVILAGDFNSTPGSAVMERLEEGWRLLDKGEDRLTFSSFDPVREIDFVLVRPADRFEVLDHRPLHEPVISDHRPLWTEFVLRATTAEAPSPPGDGGG